jgi:hypothetical protein
MEEYRLLALGGAALPMEGAEVERQRVRANITACWRVEPTGRSEAALVGTAAATETVRPVVKAGMVAAQSSWCAKQFISQARLTLAERPVQRPRQTTPAEVAGVAEDTSYLPRKITPQTTGMSKLAEVGAEVVGPTAVVARVVREGTDGNTAPPSTKHDWRRPTRGLTMRKMEIVVSVLTLACCSIPQLLAQNTVTPAWLSYLGDGSQGEYSCTSGTCVLGGESWFSSFNVSAGATAVSRSGNNTVIVRSKGACTVAGTISNSVNTAGGGGVSVNGDFGGAGGGGGGGAVSGTMGKISIANGGLPIVNSGNGGASGGGNGEAGNTPVLTQYHTLLSQGSFWPVGGSAGGQGGGNGNGTAGGVGGNGGGPVVLVCETIHFTGTIDVSGGRGASAPANSTGGGGGGGAGYVIFAAESYTANTGTVKLGGGAGGDCGSHGNCGAGGAGGGGWRYTETIR